MRHAQTVCAVPDADAITAVSTAANKTSNPLVFYAIIGLLVLSLGVSYGALRLLTIQIESSHKRYDRLLGVVDEVIQGQEEEIEQMVSALVEAMPAQSTAEQRGQFLQMLKAMAEQSKTAAMIQVENQAILMSLADALAAKEEQ